MKTNIQIELTDEQRNQLKILIDGKPSKKMVSRKEVIALCQQHISGLVNSSANGDDEARMRIMVANSKSTPAMNLYRADPEDIPLMARPDDPGYVRGWNTVKRGHAVSH